MRAVDPVSQCARAHDSIGTILLRGGRGTPFESTYPTRHS
jgi:hypothetical protein